MSGVSLSTLARPVTATGVSCYLADHLGSAAVLTATTGNVVEQLAYDSFGNGGESTLTRYGYTGRERDPDTGLMYYALAGTTRSSEDLFRKTHLALEPPWPAAKLPTHYFITAQSDNPSNPIVILDPWANKFQCKCKN